MRQLSAAMYPAAAATGEHLSLHLVQLLGQNAMAEHAVELLPPVALTAAAGR